MPDHDKMKYSYCSVPQMPERTLDPSVPPGRARLIRMLDNKWVNGTKLHYYFFDQETDGERVFFSNGTSEWRSWTTSDAEKEVVRRAFQLWKDVGIGLEFEEVGSRDEAELRIGFMRGDGAWSYIGRGVLDDRRQPAHHELRLGPHAASGRDRHRGARDRPHAGLPARASEPERRHRLGRGGGLRGARQAAQPAGTAPPPSTTSSARSSRTRCRARTGTRTRSCTIRSSRA